MPIPMDKIALALYGAAEANYERCLSMNAAAYAASAEIDRLRAALTKIATDTYDKADERPRWSQPIMIWQSVAKIALGQEPE